MSRLLVIPAAGLGTRLQSSRPKALVPVNGRPMLDHLADLYAEYVDYSVVIAHPSFAADIEAWADEEGYSEVVQQPSPTGMLDAILLAASAVARLRPDSIWITWCDQVGVLPATVGRLADVTSLEPAPALAFPTVRRTDPYIHFVRDADGRITSVLHRREGDRMPDEGESDMGLFALSRDAFDRDLHQYASDVVPGQSTGERNFLPFIPWLASRATVVTFPCTDPMEAIGINTAEELQQVEAWLRRGGASFQK
jgi:bifunctional UDP-N-acetylglucosamine pyrophosphorylase/glucosamine-1-phosphate N-acetyltransferase